MFIIYHHATKQVTFISIFQKYYSQRSTIIILTKIIILSKNLAENKMIWTYPNE